MIAVEMVSFDCRFLNRSVHPLDLAIGPRMVHLYQFYSIPFTSQIMSKRICRGYAVFRLRGCTANLMPLAIVSRTNGVPMAQSVRIV